MSGTARVRLLGRLGIEHGQRWLDGSVLPGRQARIVLAYLALCHHPVARDEPADLVWPDALTSAWERDPVVSKVRAALDSVDLGSLLHGALGCYELQLPPTPGSTSKMPSGSSRTRSRRGASETGTSCYRRPPRPPTSPGGRSFRPSAACGSSGGAMTSERRCCAPRPARTRPDRRPLPARRPPLHKRSPRAGPIRETSYVQLMRLHMSEGNRAAALRAYERCRAVLAHDLGVTPSPQTEAVYRVALGP